LLASLFLAGSGPQSKLLNPKEPDFSKAAPPTYKVLLETTKGEILLEVRRDWSPNGADRFYHLVRHGYYNDAGANNNSRAYNDENDNNGENGNRSMDDRDANNAGSNNNCSHNQCIVSDVCALRSHAVVCAVRPENMSSTTSRAVQRRCLCGDALCGADSRSFAERRGSVGSPRVSAALAAPAQDLVGDWSGKLLADQPPANAVAGRRNI